jgi:hypothetical protein
VLVFSIWTLTKQEPAMKRNPALRRVDADWTTQVYSSREITLRALHCRPKAKKKCGVRVSSNEFFASYNNEYVSVIICDSSGGSVSGYRSYAKAPEGEAAPGFK